MKKITLFIFLLMSFSMISQELSTKNIRKIRSLEIDVQNLNLNDALVQKKLNLVLKLNRRRRGNKTIAIIFTSISTVFLISIIKLSNSPNKSEANGIISGFAGSVSAGFAVASVPFWLLSSKRKKQRDVLINGKVPVRK